MEDGMRLKIEGPTILHANIHDNGLDREYNCNSDATNKLTSTKHIDSTRWTLGYDGSDSLGLNDNYEASTLRLQRPPSPAHSLADDEDDQHSLSHTNSTSNSTSSSSDVSPEAEDYRGLSQSASSDTDSEGTAPRGVRRGRGIANPNYPGFQHLADQLLSDSEDDNNNNSHSDKVCYDTPKLVDKLVTADKMADAFLSGVKEEVARCEDTNRAQEAEDTAVPRKKERTLANLNLKKAPGARTPPANLGAHQPPANAGSARRAARDRKRNSPEALGSFDVYNIETAMPTIDLDAIENHLKAAREEERRRRNDREEIRRRLATGCDADEYYGGDRPGRKPSLQSRLQSGMNLQICFMNDTMSDTESPGSDSEAPAKAVSPMKQPSPLAAVPVPKTAHPANSNIKSPRGGLNEVQTEADFFACQAKLQAEARQALAQAKDMARLQMEVERQRKQVSPITEMLRTTLLKVGVVFPEDRRRVSRQMLTDMNVAQLQVIVNDLHTQIEYLNESLVRFLMERDDLHMGQDSMLVDIEDLTRYLGAKENTFKEDISFNNNVPKTLRISGAGLVPK